MREVAVLPVVNVVDDAGASLFVENILGPHFCWRTRLSWLMPDAARRLLTRRTRHPYAQLDSLAHQVWLQGRLDSLTAGDVARQLGVPCVWCIRIDRWERLEAWDTRQVRAFVALRSAVVDTAGRVLWASGGESSSPTSLRFQAELAEVERRPGTPDWGVPLSTAELRRAPDFDQAVSDLLERWAHRFPLRRP